MWTGQEMTLVDGLMISAVGLLVVFAALAALAIAVIIISKIINTAVSYTHLTLPTNSRV